MLRVLIQFDILFIIFFYYVYLKYTFINHYDKGEESIENINKTSIFYNK